MGQSSNWHRTPCAVPADGLYYIRTWEIHHLKDIRVRVETNDGCSTVWYEKSRLKEPTGPICERVTKQLMGLNIKRIEVDLVPALYQSWNWHKPPRLPASTLLFYIRTWEIQWKHTNSHRNSWMVPIFRLCFRRTVDVYCQWILHSLAPSMIVMRKCVAMH